MSKKKTYYSCRNSEHFYKKLSDNAWLHVLIKLRDETKVSEFAFNSDNTCLINNIESPLLATKVITEEEFTIALNYARKHLLLESNEMYWKVRCLAAEKIIAETPSDIACSDARLQSYIQWAEIKNSDKKC